MSREDFDKYLIDKVKSVWGNTLYSYLTVYIVRNTCAATLRYPPLLDNEKDFTIGFAASIPIKSKYSSKDADTIITELNRSIAVTMERYSVKGVDNE